MRRNDKEITDQNTIQEILINSNVCNVALFDEEYPYVVPMNYGIKDNALYFHCALAGKKIDLINKNNKVGFVIEENSELITGKQSCQWTTKYRSIMGKGNIEIITDFDEKKEGLDILMEHHGKFDNAYSPKMVDKVLVLRLDIIEISGKVGGE